MVKVANDEQDDSDDPFDEVFESDTDYMDRDRKAAVGGRGYKF